MLEKSGEADGVYIEWHTFDEGGKKVTACFSDPDEPVWEFWCGERKVTLISNGSKDGTFALIVGGQGTRPSVSNTKRQRDATDAFLWLLG